MRMKFSIVAATLLMVSGLSLGLGSASAATKHDDKAHSATIELFNLDKPQDVLLKANFDLTKPQKLQALKAFSYVASASIKGDGTPELTPGYKTVGYAIQSEKPENGKLHLDVKAQYMGPKAVPLDKMTRQFNTFSEGGMTIELPNMTDVSAPETVALPRKNEYKEAIFIPNVGGPQSSLALRIKLHYAK